ncbi:DUF1735 domain-containing protein [Sinomicrobium weinanense]|uniref:DUF1735 domain-containing protein n=1 Tax=Sinomicrobium weinanense TaxID=2842200 RepID=A0A926JTP0_9FLAO|nr:DUF1735 domain-containing protein [Sinomicrobium weinanense]MBC9797179.1 DUF1735 domain-containing protein [Sinomicrobium weinanense]MBU3125845.1 DUF1735 domain-containing protein [Sinomicrobium weinanense]
MMTIRKITIIVLIFTTMVSCEKYEDYVEDYDFTIAYFNSQKPLRTVVAYDEMQFKVGVAMGGKRYNTVEETATFVIDPSLLDNEVLDGAGAFKLLPEAYYSLSNGNTMTFPEGRYIGDVTVTLNREEFITDSLSTSNTYALPVRITETSLDSIASGSFDDQGNQVTAPKNYAIVVIKYISRYQGTYYHTGNQLETTSDGQTNEVVYDHPDLVKNGTWNLSTINANTVETSGMGNFNDAGLILHIDEGNTVDLSTVSSEVTNFSGSGTYDPEDRSLSLEYSFTRGDSDYTVTEVLYLRRPPEEDLVFEEW